MQAGLYLATSCHQDAGIGMVTALYYEWLPRCSRPHNLLAEMPPAQELALGWDRNLEVQRLGNIVSLGRTKSNAYSIRHCRLGWLAEAK